MTAETLLATLRDRGVEFTADGGSLRYRAPKGVLTPELRDALTRHKGEILTLLQGADETSVAVVQAACVAPGSHAVPAEPSHNSQNQSSVQASADIANSANQNNEGEGSLSGGSSAEKPPVHASLSVQQPNDQGGKKSPKMTARVTGSRGWPSVLVPTELTIKKLIEVRVTLPNDLARRYAKYLSMDKGPKGMPLGECICSLAVTLPEPPDMEAHLDLVNGEERPVLDLYLTLGQKTIASFKTCYSLDAPFVFAHTEWEYRVIVKPAR